MADCQVCRQKRVAMWDNFKSWLAKPFSVDMSAGGWFVFIGLLLIIMVMWRLILVHITETIE